MIEELNNPELREIVFGNYRIAYHYNGKRVVILTVLHAARLPHWDYVLKLLNGLD